MCACAWGSSMYVCMYMRMHPGIVTVTRELTYEWTTLHHILVRTYSRLRGRFKGAGSSLYLNAYALSAN